MILLYFLFQQMLFENLGQGESGMKPIVNLFD